MFELHIIDKPIKDKSDDSREREMLIWIKYNFRQYNNGEITEDNLREGLILGIESILGK